ncbi:SAM-dependent methyltransferase [Nocardioides marmotae]|uniref:SAM-dependent methyltransferase n=1 Tax=Nocardioides marmotae TaxID=2663857 RepID=UPI00132AAF00|nr:class I SAM-dependent methyltransferase [Nocardioides marmotae]MBC9734908.1 class I SAM-dependent methyltransferase [Nocardioides marmotae]MTB86007.1 methyltransferase domain-containing protein [Nocardioides marmotae]
MDAEAWDERYAASDLVWSAGPNVFVEAECSGLPAGRALDLAAGEGRHALWLARRGWRVTALDFSAVALDKGRQVAEGSGLADAITWVRADATTWRPPAGTTYDLALLAYLQLPPAQRRAAARGAYDALAPGGALLVVAHDRTNSTEGVGGPQDPEVLMSAEDVLGDLTGLPHEVEHAGRAGRRVEPGHGADDAPARTAWDCVVRVHRAAG